MIFSACQVEPYRGSQEGELLILPLEMLSCQLILWLLRLSHQFVFLIVQLSQAGLGFFSLLEALSFELILCVFESSCDFPGICLVFFELGSMGGLDPFL